MTEQQWLASTDVTLMLEYLRSTVSDRKKRLFAVACCRQLVLVGDCRCARLIEVSERYADGLASAEELAEAGRAVGEISTLDELIEMAFFSAEDAVRAVWYLANPDNPLGNERIRRSLWPKDRAGEEKRQSDLLRDLCGNSFRPVSIAPAVLASQGGVLVRMATAIYNDRRWDDMPLLGDALEDASCNDQAVLNHCRGPGPHARGCHVVDALLCRS